MPRIVPYPVNRKQAAILEGRRSTFLVVGTETDKRRRRRDQRHRDGRRPTHWRESASSARGSRAARLSAVLLATYASSGATFTWIGPAGTAAQTKK